MVLLKGLEVLCYSSTTFADSLRFSGERMWASLVNGAIERAKGPVMIYLLASCKKTIVRRYPFMTEHAILEEIGTLKEVFSRVPVAFRTVEGATIFLDSIDLMLLTTGIDQLIKLLKEISRFGTVIARVHDECITNENWERLSSVLHIACSLDLKDMKVPLYTVVSFRNDGKKVVKVGTIKFDKSLRTTFKPYKDQNANGLVNNERLSVPNSTFDVGLHLKESERKAKQNLQLPYEAAQKKEELVKINMNGNRKIRAGGRIIYTPDEMDDIDESDPDDDLDV
ncbi:unnamed protein product [Thelazia callipaeda]|uniref:Elongator complex protein 5 n=1 Tax=Thelazia callipaeda TaxID=103827 RepID=A0A0N5CYV5_THECL|nr:unnamed protein product [Thelazia callipaeda]